MTKAPYNSAFLRFFASLLVSVIPSVTPAAPFDWPAWRGPDRTGVSEESDWKVWSAGGPKEAWRKKVGIGFSSVSVANGKVYTLGNTGGTDTVWCLDAQTGRKIWSYSYPCRLGSHPGPRMTPTVDGDLVYTMSREGDIFCFDAQSGKVKWKANAKEDFGAKQSRYKWGFACSPLVYGDILLFDLGRVVALNKKTGKVLWMTGDDIAGFSSPIVFRHGGSEYTTSFNAFGLVVVDLRTHKEVARFPWKTAWLVNAVTPIYHDGYIFISSGYGKGCALLRLTEKGLEPIYQNKQMRNHVNNSVLYEGYLYGFDGQQGSRGRLVCMEFATGKVAWRQDGLRVGSLMIAGGKIIAMLDRGELLIAEASPKAYREIARANVLSGQCWTYPVLSNGRIYCRSNKEGELVCIDVSGGKK